VQDLYKRYPQELRASSTTTGPFCSSFIEETLSIYVNLPFRSEIDSSKFCKQGRHGQFTIFLKRQNVPWQISTKWAFVSYRVVAWVWCTQMIMPFKIKRTKPAKKYLFFPCGHIFQIHLPQNEIFMGGQPLPFCDGNGNGDLLDLKMSRKCHTCPEKWT